MATRVFPHYQVFPNENTLENLDLFVGLWPWLVTSFYLIQSYLAYFYMPITLKSPPPIFRVTAHATFSGWLVSSFVLPMLSIKISSSV